MSHRRSLGLPSVALLAASIMVLGLGPIAWAASKYKSLYGFKGGKDGQAPYAGLTFDQAGNLYGTTLYGGMQGLCNPSCGVVFKLTSKPDGSWDQTVIHTFTGGADGGQPFAGLVVDPAGNLYGTTSQGGDPKCLCGVVFKLTTNSDGSWTETVIHSFLGGKDGRFVLAGLVFDEAGNLYGTTFAGGASDHGTVFKLTANSDGSWTEIVLYAFTGGKDGSEPISKVVLDQMGNIDGTAYEGGTINSRCALGCGVIFELAPNSDGSWTESVLHSFSGGRDGWGPDSLILDQTGNLYGTTALGGISSCFSDGCGVLFKLTSKPDGSWKEQVLHCFIIDKYGANPQPDSLILDSAGNLYGTTPYGGDLACGNSPGCGVVYKFVPNSKGEYKERVLHTFQNRPGFSPYGGVIFDGTGNLYGTTYGNGTKTHGSVFEVTP